MNPKGKRGQWGTILRVLNHYLLQHKQVQKSLNGILEYVKKKNDDALFQGLTLQKVNKFQYAFNTSTCYPSNSKIRLQRWMKASIASKQSKGSLRYLSRDDEFHKSLQHLCSEPN